MPTSKTEPINYSILVREKLFNKFKADLETQADITEAQLVGCTITVIGIPTLDLPMSIIDGDIGVFAYSLEVDRGNSENNIELRSSKAN
ncbi:hypothetical protein ACN92M_26710 (plasmid) [Paenibacillus polymyxa]|uniref:hypothetical protein n=1 Tax=Paenibacillus polymyxa TaxID=1406 RepID=UPI003B5B5CCE